MIGMEVEFVGLSSQAAEVITTKYKCSVGDDGSTRTPTWFMGDIPVHNPGKLRSTSVMPSGVRTGRSIGLEIITPPMEDETAYEFCQDIAFWYRDIRYDPRTSIHMHVGMEGRTWKEIRNLILWCAALEYPLYRMSAAGNTHRGETNSYKFCRPLSSPIYATFTDTLGHQPLVDIEALRNAKSASQMYAAWGRLDYFSSERNLPHYSPHRLMGFNLYSTLRLGTFEWRIFDGRYRKIGYFYDLVKAVHALADEQEAPKECDTLKSSRHLSRDQVRDLFRGANFVDKLWGDDSHVGPCRPKVESLVHHYSGITIPSTKRVSLCPVRSTSGREDTGAENFIIATGR